MHGTAHSPQRFVFQQSAVHEQRGRSPNTGRLPVFDISSDHLGGRPGRHGLCKSIGIQIEGCAKLFYFTVIEILVIFKQQIVKGPEHALFGRCNGGPGGLIRKFMATQGKLLKNDLDLGGILLQQLLEYRHQPGAIRSLEVAENHDGHSGSGRAFKWCAPDIDLFDQIDAHHANGLGF